MTTHFGLSKLVQVSWQHIQGIIAILGGFFQTTDFYVLPTVQGTTTSLSCNNDL